MPPHIDILAVGSLSDDLRHAFEHYRRLLSSVVHLSVRSVREVSLKGRSEAEVLREEGRRLLAAWPRTGVVVALDQDGQVLSSPAFAAAVQQWLGQGSLTFVIGGTLGLSDEVKARAQKRLSLSALTLPHQLARLVLVEQIFRAVKIARGETYHR